MIDVNSVLLPNDSKNLKIAVAMSGGVDSSAVVYLLKEAGYEVFGVTMRLGGKKDEQYIDDAKIVADNLGVEHYVLDIRDEFFEKVINYFSDSYIAGLTPSPCVLCNRYIKFGELFNFAFEKGADLVVTGHYARLEENGNEYAMKRADDKTRDQSYFMALLTKEQISKARFPLARYTKDEVREIAKKAGLDVASKKDSQDICFVENDDYIATLKTLRPEYEIKEGDIVDVNGNLLGRHKGVVNYTVGQRRGLGIGGGDPLFVIRIDAEKNQVIVGSKDDLHRKEVHLTDVSWLGDGDKPVKLKANVKLRSRQAPVAATIFFENNDKAVVIMDEPFRGVAPGQICCIYSNDGQVLGGGIIS